MIVCASRVCSINTTPKPHHITSHHIHAELKTKKINSTHTGTSPGWGNNRFVRPSINPCCSQTSSTANRTNPKKHMCCTPCMYLSTTPWLISSERRWSQPHGVLLRIGPPRTSNFRNLQNWPREAAAKAADALLGPAYSPVLCLVRRGVINVIIFHCCRCCRSQQRQTRPRLGKGRRAVSVRMCH